MQKLFDKHMRLSCSLYKVKSTLEIRFCGKSWYRGSPICNFTCSNTIYVFVQIAPFINTNIEQRNDKMTSMIILQLIKSKKTKQNKPNRHKVEKLV